MQQLWTAENTTTTVKAFREAEALGMEQNFSSTTTMPSLQNNG
jgi:hypothetical protein